MSNGCPRRRVAAVTGVNVLVIDGIGANSVSHALAGLAAESSLDQITVNVFDRLGDLPRYSATLDARRTPEVVVTLRGAVSSAEAALIVTDYHGPIAPMVHNAIDWLTDRCNDGALHDKPLAVMGRAGGCYGGVWSHRQPGDGPGMAGPRVVAPLTVATLREAVRALAGEAVQGGGEASGPLPAAQRRRSPTQNAATVPETLAAAVGPDPDPK
jgi:NADPH-dependent FMN reductase